MNATRGEHLVQELLWVHGILRSDLETVSRLANEVLSGREPEGVREDITRRNRFRPPSEPGIAGPFSSARCAEYRIR